MYKMVLFCTTHHLPVVCFVSHLNNGTPIIRGVYSGNSDYIVLPKAWPFNRKPINTVVSLNKKVAITPCSSRASPNLRLDFDSASLKPYNDGFKLSIIFLFYFELSSFT